MRYLLGVCAGALMLTAFLPAPASATGKYATGYVREPDEIYQAAPLVPRFRAFLPPAADLSGLMPPIGDQGQQGSCTAWSVAYALRSYYGARERDWDMNDPAHVFSPAFLYNKLINASGKCDQGTYIGTALELVQRDGVPSLADFPYNARDCTRNPNDQSVVAIAQRFRINGWRRFDTAKLDDIKGQIHAGNPVVFGMQISKSFEDVHGDQIYDDTTSPRIGGHAMVLVGYDDARQAFKLMNSWGTDWGDRGFGWVSYRALKQLSDRAFVMDVPMAPPPAPVPVQPVVVVEPVVTPPVPEPVVTPPKPAPVVTPPTPVVTPPEPVTPPKPVPVVTPLTPAQIERKVAEMTRGVECAALRANVGADRRVRLRGFIGARADLDGLGANIRALPGVKGVATDVLIRPWPQCEALLTFGDALANERGLKVAVRGAQPAVLSGGDRLVIEITTPSYPTYLYVTYLQASGDAVHLYKPVGRVPKALPPNTRIVLGEGAGQPTYRVGAPFGDEMIVAIAAASPLFGNELPATEIEREYLTGFRKAFLEKPRAGAPKRVVSAAVTTLTTRAKE